MIILRHKKDNKFLVLVSDGVHLKRYPVYAVVGYNGGYRMSYKDDDGVADVVYIGREYKFLEADGKYLVGKQLGNNSACPVCVGMAEAEIAKVNSACVVVGESSDKDCPGDDLSSLILSDFFGVGIKTIYGKTSIPWKWVLIIGMVALLIFAAVKFSSGGA